MQIPAQVIEETFLMAEELIAKIEADPSQINSELDELLQCILRVLGRWPGVSVPRLDGLIARRAAVLQQTPFAAAIAAKRKGPK